MQKIWVQFLGWEDQLKKELATHSSVLVWETWEIKPVNLKGNQPWIVTGRANVEAPVFWSSDVNRWLIEKVPDAGKDWGQKEKRASGWDGWTASLVQWTWTWADSMRWGTGGLVCCSPWGQSWTWLVNWTTTALNTANLPQEILLISNNKHKEKTWTQGKDYCFQG